ncbi:MAG: ABC transporter permease [Cyanobacterium sp. T60_A2020_053]|nr:ABC transporter permease [Cyanobacterium sp. T60_A2020_053]
MNFSKYYYETSALSQRILTELIKRKRSLIFWSIFPLSILFINGYILSERANLELSEAFKLSAPTSLTGAALFFSCLGGSVSTVVSEREQKTLKRLFISPLSGVSYFLGIFLAHFSMGMGQTILVYFTLFLLGETIEGSVFLGLIILFLSIASYVGVGLILGTNLAKRTEDVNAIVATFGVPLLIIGGTFLPTSLFPDGLLKIAQFNPIFHMNEAMIQLWANGDSFNDIKNHFWFLLVFSIMMMISGWFSYYRMIQTEKTL